MRGQTGILPSRGESTGVIFEAILNRSNLFQMMENAGRNLALVSIERWDNASYLVLAGRWVR